MAEKYQFNPTTLSYTKVNTTKQLVFRSIPYILFSVVIITLVFGFRFAGGKSSIGLKKENEMLARQLLELQGQLQKMNSVLDELAYRDNNIYRSVFATEPISLTVRNAGIGGIDRYTEYKNLQQADAVIETTQLTDVLSRKIAIQSKSYDKIIDLIKENSQFAKSLPAIQPIRNEDFTQIGSGFGYRIHPIYGISMFHSGIDFTAPEGKEIFATGNGVVMLEQEKMSGYGNYIVIEHGFGYKTVYAHLSSIMVKDRQKVKRGDVIGLVGNTGVSTGSHLHYEVRYKDTPLDPVNFFSAEVSASDYNSLIITANRNGKSFD